MELNRNHESFVVSTPAMDSFLVILYAAFFICQHGKGSVITWDA